jgi:hypothetical protein
MFSGNKLVVTMMVLFVIVAMTGYIPWMMKLSGWADVTREIFLESHDKIAFILILCLVIHVRGTFRWFIVARGK